jgi:predicted AAA+ superfamily ATPase
MELLLRSLARNESTTITNKKLKADIQAVDDADIDVETVAAYLDVFTRLFLLDNQKPFAARIRSSVRVKQAEKRHFADPSLACALLKATPEMLLGDLNTLGFLFEALCERDLKIYAEAFDAEVYHYQDYNNKEIDAVVQLPGGDWSAFEIKLGANQIDAAAKSLLALQNEALKDPNGKPAKSLCVLCGLSNAAYQRPDGVYVVPITALKD